MIFHPYSPRLLLLHSHYLCSLLLLGSHVTSHKELSKKDKQTHNVHKVHLRHTKWQLITPLKHQHGSLEHHNSKLYQLQRSQTTLPPNGQRLSSLVISGMHADEVVRVHNRVDESVQQDGEVNISIIVDIGIEPIEQENSGVMVNVQEGELTPLLSQNNKDCVPKVPYFGDVEEP